MSHKEDEGTNPAQEKGGSKMDYSFENAQIEVLKNFSGDEQLIAIAERIAETNKEKEEKDNA